MLADASAKARYNTDIVIDAPVAVQDKNHGICTGRLASVALCSCVALAAAVNPSLDSSRLWVQSRLTLQQHPTVLGAQQVDRRLPTLREGKSLWTAPSDVVVFFYTPCSPYWQSALQPKPTQHHLKSQNPNSTQRHNNMPPKGRTFCRAEMDATRTQSRCACGHRA